MSAFIGDLSDLRPVCLHDPKIVPAMPALPETITGESDPFAIGTEAWRISQAIPSVIFVGASEPAIGIR